MARYAQGLLLGGVLLAQSGLMTGCERSTEVTIGSVGDTMVYDKTEFEAPAGGKVKLTLKNNGTSPAMLHDWVLINPGTEMQVVAAATKVGDAGGWIPNTPDVLAHTKLVKQGDSDTVEFTAPAKAGDYPYICTYPGHFALMKGVMHVK